MIAECILCTCLNCDALHSSIASSMAAVLTTSRLASTTGMEKVDDAKQAKKRGEDVQNKLRKDLKKGQDY
jgi:hypothetical protein